MKLNRRYIPTTLSKRDRTKQINAIQQTRKNYRRGIYQNRPHLSSFHSRPSGHIAKAKRMYNIDSLQITPELVKKTGCSNSSLQKIIEKGRGAYYSSGSRPNQTADSWAYARLASAITGGPASRIDKDILIKGCKPNSRALHRASLI